MTPRVHVIGLGPAGPDLVTTGALELMGSVPTHFLRTERHPAAMVMPHAQWFDLLYESADSIDEVYRSIVEALVNSASINGEILYAVPGSPAVAEHTVELLVDDDRVETIVHPALSFLDLTWARLGVDPVRSGVSFIDGHRFEVDSAGLRGPLLVGQCDSRFVLSDIKLSVDEAPTEQVVVLQRLGLGDERIFAVEWQDLDRSFEPDHLTSLWIPTLQAPVAGELMRTVELIRGGSGVSDGSSRVGIEPLPSLEQAVSALGTARSKYDPETGVGSEELCSRLGDLLHHVVADSESACADGWFTLADVASDLAGRISGGGAM